MTFLFEDIISGEIRYVNASDFADAIDIFEAHTDFTDSAFDQLHVYVRIV